MESLNKLGVRFERCPKCGAVVIFKEGTDIAVCEKCKVKIRLKK
jgi:ribosomal protein S27AE